MYKENSSMTLFFLLCVLYSFLTVCDGLVCKHGGTALKNGTCACRDKYTGSHCQYRRGRVCEHDGFYELDRCKCQPGFYGESCQYRFCVNGRLKKHSKTECLCNTYFEGPHCDLPKCTEGGVRINGTCYCHEGFAGTFCDELDCGEHGRLYFLPPGPYRRQKCSCFGGWYGDRCQYASHCVNGVPYSKLGKCICPDLWEGDLCDIPKCYYGNRTADGNCTCIGNYAQPHCHNCIPGFRGIDCQEPFQFNTTFRTYRMGNGALAMGLVVGFTAMVCFSTIFLYRCLAVLCGSLTRSATEKRRRNTQADNNMNYEVETLPIRTGENGVKPFYGYSPQISPACDLPEQRPPDFKTIEEVVLMNENDKCEKIAL